MPLQRRDHNKIKRVKNKEIPELSALKIPFSHTKVIHFHPLASGVGKNLSVSIDWAVR